MLIYIMKLSTKITYYALFTKLFDLSSSSATEHKFYPGLKVTEQETNEQFEVDKKAFVVYLKLFIVRESYGTKIPS